MKWYGKFEIQGHDTDFQETAKASSVVEYMQEAARKHLDICTSTLDELKRNNSVFVLCRLTLANYKSLKANDEVTVETWASTSHGVSYPRYTKMHKDNELAAELATVWTTINTETRRIVKMGDVIDKIAEQGEPLSMGIPPRMKFPQTATLSLMAEYYVGYSVCDVNGHMNNVRYVDMFTDYLRDGLKNKRITNIDIAYINEAPMGETLKIYTSQEVDDGKYYLRAVRSDGKICAEAEFIIDEI